MFQQNQNLESMAKYLRKHNQNKENILYIHQLVY